MSTGKHAAPTPQKPSKRKVPVWLIIIFIVSLLASAFGIHYVLGLRADAQRIKELNAQQQEPTAVKQDDDSSSLPANPIDFASLQKQNSDIYAWLNIPGTNINTAVSQSATDDEYYLDHDSTGAYNAYGSIFSQSKNSKDFSDPVTVLYGHVSHEDDIVFTDLHKFEDKTFFNEHDTFYIYTPGHQLTYKVIAAYRYDDRHILNSFDFSNQQVLQDYYDSVLNPDSVVSNVREGATLNAATDKIVQMSTCMLDEFHGPHRYIVTGVLVNDQQTL